MILYLLNLVLNKVLFLIHVYLFQYYRKWIFSPNHPCSREHFPHLSVTGNWIWEVCRSCRSWAVKQNGWNWTRLKEKKENCIHHSRFRQTEKSVHFVLFRQTKSTNCSHAMQRQDTEDVQKSTIVSEINTSCSLRLPNSSMTFCTELDYVPCDIL